MRHRVPAPDNQHSAEFIIAGEIRFGPAYFSLALDGLVLPERLFGNEALWSPDSRYLAVQEWLAVAGDRGPHTALLCLDITTQTLRRVSSASGGFITPLRFEADKLIYHKRYFSAGGERCIEYEIAFAALPDWEPLTMS
ncbi:hypothetical protein FJU30_08885 [Affinibrenneria salicis]|uniref:Uncharacterized protein n=1 Tax=Affinibrenneria salicis TaxID=2590031 RepID=A0A5J5G3T4_9GAMM|nr:hypothetical protein [Affinibrenneria salicis]KAA9001321.1 hypothetical protein FJU30_08885 [Affinibrenneria salicis]